MVVRNAACLLFVLAHVQGYLQSESKMQTISRDVSLKLPTQCTWALEQLYVPQRCARYARAADPCDATKRKFDAETVTMEMTRAFKSFFPALPPSSSMQGPRVVDIGAGLAMYHPFILAYFHGRSEHYIVDRSSARQDRDVGRSIGKNKYLRASGGFNNSAFGFYSSLECAKDIALVSGFTSTNFKVVEASTDNVEALGTVDIVMSILSWTFHYPVEAYAMAVKKILKPHSGRLIVTVKYSPSMPNSTGYPFLRFGFVCIASNVSTLAESGSEDAKAHWRGGWFPSLMVCCSSCQIAKLISGMRDPSVWKFVL